MILGRRIHEEERELRLPGEGEVLGVIVQMLGHERMKVLCADGYTRICRVPGRYKKRLWFREGDVVLVAPWDFQPKTKGDLIWRYTKSEVRKLKEMGHLDKLEEEYGEELA
ncbi:MAG: translation initiation factor IF-1A [Thermoprotei archaeon]|nr:translation initiation factor IF-1A [Thermoprotei archaeon]